MGFLLESTIQLIASARVTLGITIAAFILGQFAGLLVALARTSKHRSVRTVSLLFTFSLRGSPLLVQIFLLYYALSQLAFIRESILWPILREPYACAILAIGINSSAYMGELIRGAMLNLPAGQSEAALALGLKRRYLIAFVVLPQTYRNLIPAIGNEFVLVLKASALASVITLMDITGTARTIAADTYRPFETFALAGLVYLAIGYAAGILCKAMETRYPVMGRIGHLQKEGRK